MRRTVSPRRRLASWIGITALAVQALIPFAQALPGPNGVPIVICKVAGQGTSTQNTPARGGVPGSLDGGSCVVCFAATSAKITEPGTVFAQPMVLVAAVLSPAEHRITSTARDSRGFLARAPPQA